MKLSTVTINDTTPVLLAKGPGRVRLYSVPGTYGALRVGDNTVTATRGVIASVNTIDEFRLSKDEKLFGIATEGSPPGLSDVGVMLYGLP